MGRAGLDRAGLRLGWSEPGFSFLPSFLPDWSAGRSFELLLGLPRWLLEASEMKLRASAWIAQMAPEDSGMCFDVAADAPMHHQTLVLQRGAARIKPCTAVVHRFEAKRVTFDRSVGHWKTVQG